MIFLKKTQKPVHVDLFLLAPSKKNFAIIADLGINGPFECLMNYIFNQYLKKAFLA